MIATPDTIDRAPRRRRPAGLCCARADTPLGEVTLLASPAGLRGLYFADHRGAPDLRPGGPPSAILDEARRQLDGYFAGARTRFAVPLDAVGTPFQRAVWALLAEIPFGETTSYGALARRLGSPRAVRAVGAANGRNPVSIIVPCHRVVGADGALRGYAGGERRKRWLLEHERAGR